eukprot:544672-Amphidinium_carterae.1
MNNESWILCAFTQILQTRVKIKICAGCFHSTWLRLRPIDAAANAKYSAASHQVGNTRMELRCSSRQHLQLSGQFSNEINRNPSSFEDLGGIS